jgi:hypothetical protein
MIWRICAESWPRLPRARASVNKAELYRSVLADTADQITADVTKIKGMFSDIMGGKAVTFTLDDAAQPSTFEIPPEEIIVAEPDPEPFALPAE